MKGMETKAHCYSKKVSLNTAEWRRFENTLLGGQVARQKGFYNVFWSRMIEEVALIVVGTAGIAKGHERAAR